jgi:hypothetical protein
MVDGRRPGRKQARVLWPLPGGAGNYLRSLRIFLDLAEDEPLTDDFVARIVRRFRKVSSTKTARSYAHVVIDLGLLEMRQGCIAWTREGQAYAETGDSDILRRALINRIAGVSDLIEELRSEPDRIGRLIPRMQERGFDWQGPSQIRYRLRWLEEIGLVKKEGRARPIYSLTNGRSVRGSGAQKRQQRPARGH